LSTYRLLRSVLFRLDPEKSHELGITALRGLGSPVLALGSRRRRERFPVLAQELLGLHFPNPFGIAAGFDKNAVAFRGLAALGFGSAEVGTVTPLPQPGNPKPRLFRHPAALSLQNSLGFNSAGLEAVERHLRSRRPPAFPLGVNIGLNKGAQPPTPESALASYASSIVRLGPLADYLAINLSSPNTPGLRDLQTEEFVRELLTRAGKATDRPVFVKLSPDLTPEVAADLADVAVLAGAAGIIATNTTIDYRLLPGIQPVGGLSGRVLRERSFDHLRALASRLRGRAVLISVGGIDSAAEAYRRIRAGASLIQIYTGFVYGGPGLARRLASELAALLEAEGFPRIGDAVGVDLTP
jgi:dihydroorotate dehydrogenase